MAHILHSSIILLIPVLGLFAGVLGGMLGVGGSVIMIPALTIMFGYNLHLYAAAAMIANVAVSVPAALRHRRAAAINADALMWILPAAVIFVVLGVWTSNLPVFSGGGGVWLGRILSAFLVYVVYINVYYLVRGPRRRTMDQPPKIAPGRGLAVGTVMGFSSGLLGIGGGGIAVPLQQILLKLPLRVCIANSSTIICLSAGIGAIYKNLTLPQHGYSPWTGVLVGALLSPTAAIGGRYGASLTHKLPTSYVRIAFVLMMVAGAWKMAELPFSPF